MGTLSLGASAQKVDNSKVPAPVSTAFTKQYPGATAKWKMEKGNYEATFKQQGHEMSAEFQPNGTLVETESAIKVSELPAAVTTYVQSHYKGSKITEAEKITKANGQVNYEARVNGKELMFDSNGVPIKGHAS